MATYTFISMIVLADEHGIVNMSAEALGKRIGLPGGDGSFLEWEEFRRGLDILTQEDAFSNLPTENGRRIIPMSEITNGEENRGWLIVNYDFYRKKASKSDTKEKTRDRVRRFRERKCNAPVTDGNGCEGDTDTDTDTDNSLREKKRKTLIPKDFCVTNDMISYARKLRYLGNLESFTDNFISACEAHGYKYKNFYAAWQTWLRKDIADHPELQEKEVEVV